MRQARLMLPFLFAGSLSACAVWPEPRIERPKPLDSEDAIQVQLVADNQTHYVWTEDSTTSTALDANGVGIRPVALDLFGLSLLEHALDERRDTGEPIVHLGDAADVACVAEIEPFFETMNRAGRPWVFAPGNHDMALMGNFDPAGEEWVRACAPLGKLDKNTLITRYLDAQARCEPGTCAFEGLEAARTGPADVLRGWPTSGTWPPEDGAAGPPGSASRLPASSRIAWDINPKQPWKSWVLQDLRVPGEESQLRVILLDTVTYKHQRAGQARVGWLAFSGRLDLEKHLPRAALWLTQCGATEGCVSVIGGHHQYARRFGGLLQVSRAPLRALFRTRGRPLAYLSAHTHKGYLRLENQPDEGFFEINVGSTLDWPLSYRTIEVGVQTNGSSRLRSNRHFIRLDSEGDRATCEGVSRPAAGWYTAYRGHRSLTKPDKARSERAVHRHRMKRASELLAQRANFVFRGRGSEALERLVESIRKFRPAQDGGTDKEVLAKRTRELQQLYLDFDVLRAKPPDPIPAPLPPVSQDGAAPASPGAPESGLTPQPAPWPDVEQADARFRQCHAFWASAAEVGDDEPDDFELRFDDVSKPRPAARRKGKK